MDGQTTTKIPIDWQWVVAGYCYLVLFHLFPTYLMNGFSIRYAFFPEEALLKESALAMIWLMGGVGVVAFVVGWKSRGITIIEPLVAGVLYGLTMAVGYHSLVSSYSGGVVLQMLVSIFWLLMIAILSAGCAWIGEAYQKRQELGRGWK